MKAKVFLSCVIVMVFFAVCFAAEAPVAKVPFETEKAKEFQKLTAEFYGIPVEKSLELGNGVKMDFVLIPAADFYMGSPSVEEGRDDDEGPAHHVKITKPFYMAKFEVTQKQYKTVFGENTVWANKEFKFKGDNLPVENAKWLEVERFLKKMSEQTGQKLRFPTEAEWEFACRAGTETPFYTGKTISSDGANYEASRVYGIGEKGLNMEKTVDVGSYKPNPFGLYDMHGNVWEWCNDWYGKTYYTESVTDDPPGPVSGKERVVRGGSWKNWPKNCRSADRQSLDPDKERDNIGIRPVLELPVK